jgi:hypothetical protein
MPMNNRILRPLARPLLLDAVPGAAAAYSLRQLSNAYTGPVVTVRRSSDDAEADFKASEIDDGTLTAFCGAGDGLVKTWHDQSGNGRDASQVYQQFAAQMRCQRDAHSGLKYISSRVRVSARSGGRVFARSLLD